MKAVAEAGLAPPSTIAPASAIRRAVMSRVLIVSPPWAGMGPATWDRALLSGRRQLTRLRRSGGNSVRPVMASGAEDGPRVHIAAARARGVPPDTIRLDRRAGRGAGG